MNSVVTSIPAWAGQTALVVDDSVVQRNHIVALLRELGFGAVLEAVDGNDALARTRWA